MPMPNRRWRASMRTALTTNLRIYYHLRHTATYRMGSCKRCARLTKALALAPESLRFQGSRQFGIDACMANGKNISGNTTARRNRPSLPVSQALGAKTCARRLYISIPSCCARHTSLRASYSPDKAQHQLRPPKLRIPIPYYTSYNTMSPFYTPLRGNDCIGSSDLLDSGGWAARSLQVQRQRCTDGQRGAHPWGHNDGPRGHFHKSCN